MPSSRLLLALVSVFAPVSASFGGDLGGSRTSMRDQHEVAVESDYTFSRKPADVERLVELGRLVEVRGNADFALSKVSFAFARPEVLRFIESLAADYRDEFGFQLVVTSLTRPTVMQPANAHRLSVHPAGMAVDLRVPAAPARKEWLEARLLSLEDAGAVEVTRERNPPHYHVAVFAEKYMPIAVVEDSTRVERRVRAQVMRIAGLAAGGPAHGSSAFPAGLLLCAALMTIGVGGPVVARSRQRKRRIIADR
jgi:hypothetical protein